MIYSIVMLLHIMVLGYWLGSELVINSTYRYFSYAKDMPFKERDALLAHVMKVDQHVRYALVLQLSLGFILAFRLGYLPGSTMMMTVALISGLTWLCLVEVTHRVTHRQWIATVDRMLRYVVIIGLIGLAMLAPKTMPFWLATKLLCFAAVMSCGVGIRLILIRLFNVWAEIGVDGSTASRESSVRKIYWQATSVLLLLWVFIIAIAVLSLLKPA